MADTTIRRSPVHDAVVLANGWVTPRMRRVTVSVEALRHTVIAPAQDFELHLREPGGRRVKRRYTVRHARLAAAEFDLDVALHGDGPGAAWGQQATPGDTVQLQGPRGKLALRPAAWHLLVGDESALPAIACIVEALPPSEPALAVVEVADAAEEQTVAAADVRWQHRDGRPPGTPDLLAPAVDALALPPGPGHAYLLGETRTMVLLRAMLEERGLAHEAIFVKGYWNQGRPDRIAGRTPAP